MAANCSGASFFAQLAWNTRDSKRVLTKRKGPEKSERARFLLPFFLCAQIFVERETSGYEADGTEYSLTLLLEIRHCARNVRISYLLIYNWPRRRQMVSTILACATDKQMPKSFFCAPSCVPGCEHAPWLAFKMSLWNDIKNAHRSLDPLGAQKNRGYWCSKFPFRKRSLPFGKFLTCYWEWFY